MSSTSAANSVQNSQQILHDVFVTDRIPFSIGERPGAKKSDSISSRYEVTGDTAGGAGRVVAGDATAVLDTVAKILEGEGQDIHHQVDLIGVAKTPAEKQLAREQAVARAEGHDAVFRFQYGDHMLNLTYVEAPEPDYTYGRDGYVSGQFWFLAQEIDHPDIRTNWEDKMWAGFKTTNRVVAGVTDQVALPGARVWVHDNHNGLVGPELTSTYGRHDLKKMLVLHTSWMTKEFLQAHLDKGKGLQLNRDDEFVPVPYDVLKEYIGGLCEYDAVNLSSDIWVRNFKGTVEWFGLEAPSVSSVPVPLDRRHVQQRASSPRVLERAEQVRASLGDRQLVAFGGRAEWYKQIEKAVKAELWRRRFNPTAPETVTAVLSSPTRPEVPNYLSHFTDDVIAGVDAANAELAPELFAKVRAKIDVFELERAELSRSLENDAIHKTLVSVKSDLLELNQLPHSDEIADAIKVLEAEQVTLTSEIKADPRSKRVKEIDAAISDLRENSDLPVRLVDGSNYESVLAWMENIDVWITPAELDGYNLMALEAQAVGKDSLVQVMSTTTGLSSHMEQYSDPRDPAAFSVRMRVVRIDENDPNRAQLERYLELEIANLAMTVDSALQLAPELKLQMKGHLDQLMTDFTPAQHMADLIVALDKGVTIKVDRILEGGVKHGFVQPDELQFVVSAGRQNDLDSSIREMSELVATRVDCDMFGDIDREMNTLAADVLAPVDRLTKPASRRFPSADMGF